MRIVVLLLLMVCQPLSAHTAQSAGDSIGPDLSPVFTRLQTAATGIQSLASNFVQEKRLAMFDASLLSEGRFLYRQPAHLRWELLTPVASGFVLRDRQGERWNSLSQETSSFRIDSDPIMGIIAQQLLAWARVDIDWLKGRYLITLLSEAPVRLQLVPRDPGEAGFIEQLQILFAVDDSHIVLVEMFEAGGDKTLMRFSQVEVNRELLESDFQAPEYQ